MAKKYLKILCLLSIQVFLLSMVIMGGWAPISLAGPLQRAHLAVIAGQAVADSPCETTWISQENRDSYWGKRTYLCQKLDVDSEKTICEVQLLVRADDQQSESFHIEFWSDTTRSGTQYGDDSISVSAVDTDTAWEWFTATWSGTKPTFSSDVYMHVVYEGLDKFQVGTSNTVTDYETTDYDFWVDNTTPSDIDDDLCMRIKTQ